MQFKQTFSEDHILTSRGHRPIKFLHMLQNDKTCSASAHLTKD